MSDLDDMQKTFEASRRVLQYENGDMAMANQAFETKLVVERNQDAGMKSANERMYDRALTKLQAKAQKNADIATHANLGIHEDFAGKELTGEITEVTLTAEELEEVHRKSESSIKSEETLRERKLNEKKKKSSKDAENIHEAYKKVYKEGQGGVITADNEMVKSKWFHDNVLTAKAYKDDDGQTVTQQQLLHNVQQGDYSRLESMDVTLRNLAATEYIKNLKIESDMTAEDFVDEIYKNQGVQGLMNPMLRIGISMCMKTNGIKEVFPCDFTNYFYTKNDLVNLDGLINAKIMSVTMSTIPDAGHMLEQAGDNQEEQQKVLDSLKRNRQSQVFMAKTLFAAHLAGLRKIDKTIGSDWEGPIANAFAHCSRVGFILPGDNGGEDTDEKRRATTNAFTGAGMGREAGFYRRMAATHALVRKSKSGKTGYEEQKKKLGWLIGQNGMNVAIGGLGNQGVSGAAGMDRTLKNDGSCGHIYMHVDEGNASKYTGIMVGFESDGPGVMNQTGHTHGAGNGEFQSSFGGQRTDEIGDKYGGRVVDASNISAKFFRLAMTGMEQVMNTLLTSGKDSDAILLRNITDGLTGTQMSRAEITDLIKMCITNSPDYDGSDINPMLTEYFEVNHDRFN